MGVPRGTTPTFLLTFSDEGLDLTEAQSVYVTFRMGGRAITKTGEDLVVEAKQITVSLTQAESLVFPDGKVKVQANWVFPDGGRAASTVCLCSLTEQLLPKVVG